jgi:SET domain-containing protein
VPQADDPATTVAASMIAGRGVFAAEPVRAGRSLAAVAIDVLNHSCEPTLGWTADGRLVAVRDIAVGDELTTDYATSIDDPEFVMNCHCETYRCRQLIEGTDWQIPQLQKRYAGHWAPAVQARIDRAHA